ncbi:MAG: IclR family transcriptional regulator [Thermodesulfobacteriota bacterium]
MAGRNTHQSLERGLRILEVLAEKQGPVALHEIAGRSSLARSTAYHLLQALVRLEYVLQDQETRNYFLSPKIFRLTQRTWSKEQLAEIAAPYLDELSRQTGEGSSLAILRDGTVTIIAKREPEGPVRVVQEVGAQRPIHCSAVGKCLAAWLSEQQLSNVINQIDFVRHTPKTITSPRVFRQELKRIRARGFAFDDEEHIPGIRCLATPVWDYSGEVRAALCVVGPKNHLPKRRLKELYRALSKVSAHLSARLGYEPEQKKPRSRSSK